MTDKVPFTSLIAGDLATTYTARSIVITDTGGAVTVGNVFIDGSGNVGIGTSTVRSKLDINGNYTLKVVPVTGSSINCGSGNYFTLSSSGYTTTFTFDNVPQGCAYGFIFEITNGGAATVIWPATVKWPYGTAPVLTASGVDVLCFITDDGGASWRGVASMIDSR